MKFLSPKQNLALKRGQFRRHYIGCKGLLGYVYYNREQLCLSLSERALIQQAYLLLSKIDDNYIETGIQMGLKRKIFNDAEITVI